jgi:hypothetical protein
MSNFRVIPASLDLLAASLGQLVAAVRIGWAWMLLLTAAQTLASEQFLHGALPILALWLIIPVPWLDAPLQAHGLHVLGLLAFASFSVNWHRHLMLAEGVQWRHLLRLDLPVWLLLLNLLPLLAAALAIDLAAEHLTGQFPLLGGLHWSFLLLLQLTLMAIWLMLLHRMAMTLPAAALGRKDYAYSTALRDSGGKPVPVSVFVLLVCAAVYFGAGLIGFASSLVLPLLTGYPAAVLFIFAVTMLLTTWLAFILTATCHAVLYGIFGEGRSG